MYYRTLILLFVYLLISSCTAPIDSSAPVDDDENTDRPAFSYSQREQTGSSAKDLLSADPFSALIVEIDYMEGFAPEQSSLDKLQQFLENYLNKPSGVQIITSAVPSAGETSYNVSEIINLEDEYRDEFARPDTLTAYLLITDAPYDNNSVLGIAYLNTSMSLSGSTIADNSGGLGQPSQTSLESTVLNHEFGHILGLVNIGSAMETDHEDNEHPAHCTTESCLMFWAVETTDFIGNLTGGNIPELDSFCVQDLEANTN
ncbi:peptidase [Balneola sp. MJW-20]|uniref:peptidase n=1 Tax=Gracilimonas aurantiaca TaxID=3234185 RepID=UPI003465A7EE